MTIVIKTTHMITWHYDDITSQYIRYLGNLWSHETFKFTLKNKYGGFKIIKSNVIKCELRLNLSEHAQLKKITNEINTRIALVQNSELKPV